MRKLLPLNSTRTIWLLSEFVVVVLGVLVALAVDSWITTRKNDEIRAHLLESLLMDLREDRDDNGQFVDHSRKRVTAAQLILNAAASHLDETEVDNKSVRAALFVIAGSSRLETVEVTFSEMSALGTGSTIEDNKLRLDIAHYYGLARTKTDINEMLMPDLLRYREALADLGMSFSDQEGFDVEQILGDKKIMAIVRNLGWWAEFAVVYTEGLIQANQDLISKIETISK